MFDRVLNTALSIGLSRFSTSGACRTLLNINMMKLLYENSSRLKAFNHFRRQSIIINACQGPLYTSSKYSFRLNKKKQEHNTSLSPLWYCTKKTKVFGLRIASVNVTKSARNCGFGHIYWRNPYQKTSFLVQCDDFEEIFVH